MAFLVGLVVWVVFGVLIIHLIRAALASRAVHKKAFQPRPLLYNKSRVLAMEKDLLFPRTPSDWVKEAEAAVVLAWYNPPLNIADGVIGTITAGKITGDFLYPNGKSVSKDAPFYREIKDDEEGEKLYLWGDDKPIHFF